MGRLHSDVIQDLIKDLARSIIRAEEGTTTEGAASFVGTGTFSAVGAADVESVASFTGTGTLTAVGDFLNESEGVATFSGTGALSAVGAAVAEAVAAFSGAGALSAVGGSVAESAASFAGTGALSAVGQAVGSFSVGNQTVSVGADTRTGAGAAGGATFSASQGTIASIGTPTGTNVADLTISLSTGVVSVSPSGNGLANGPYSITVPCYDGAGQTGNQEDITLTVNTPADTYHIYDTSQATTQWDAAVTAGINGKTVIARTGSALGDISLSGLTLTSGATLKGEDSGSKPSLRYFYSNNPGAADSFTLQDIIVTNPGETQSQLCYITGAADTLSFSGVDFVGNIPSDAIETDFYTAIDYTSASAAPQIGDEFTGGTSGEKSDVVFVDDNGDGTGTIWANGGTRSGVGQLFPQDMTNGETISKDGGGWTATVDGAPYGGITGNIKAVFISGADCDVSDLSFTGCTAAYCDGINLCATNSITFTDNVMTNIGMDDFVKVFPSQSTTNSPPTVTIDRCEFGNALADPRMAGNPHQDAIQFTDGSNEITSPAVWSGIVIEDCKFYQGDTFGESFAHIFCSNITASMTMNVRNGLHVTRETVHAVTIANPVNCNVYNCTVVEEYPATASFLSSINVDGGSDNTVRNCVSPGFDIGTATTDNNVTLGLGGATISYATAFAGSDFTGDVTSVTSAVTKYEPAQSGPLVAATTYALGDVGCIDNTPAFFPWNPSSVTDSTAPTLSNPVDTASGSTAATGSVDTDEANGTLYWVVTTSNTAPSKAQVKAGQDHTGSAATDDGSQSVSGTGTQTLSPAPSGLTASTSYYIHFMHEDAAANQSDVSSGDGFTTAAADVTAPTLSSPTDAADGSTAATASVSTNEGNGTLYWVITQSATSPSAAQVKAGNDHTSTAADDSGSQSVSGTGVQNLSPAPSGLTASTTYYAHFMHEDAATNQSSVSSADGFTTAAGFTETSATWDGSTEDLRRTSALTGASDGPSALIYIDADISSQIWKNIFYATNGSGTDMEMYIDNTGNGHLTITGIANNLVSGIGSVERHHIFVEMSPNHVRVIDNGSTALNLAVSSPTYPLALANWFLLSYDDDAYLACDLYRFAMWTGEHDPTDSAFRDLFYNSSTGEMVDPATAVSSLTGSYGLPIFDIHGNAATQKGATNDQGGRDNHFTYDVL